MNEQIINTLLERRGKFAWITIGNADPIFAGVDIVDENYKTVRLINAKGNAELKALQERRNAMGEEERAIVNNPTNFSVIPIHEIGKVEIPG